jgi:hypothetical protein
VVGKGTGMSSIRLALSRLNHLARRLSKSAFSNAAAPKDVAHFDLKSKFTKIYEGNIFGGRESRSGEGSNLKQTNVIRREIPNLLAELHIETFLDAPCGDWHWMRATNLGAAKYIGVDIVTALIAQNMAQFCSNSVRFLCADLAKDVLPSADLILCRDCLVHVSFEDAFAILRNFRSTGARYLLTTTFSARKLNVDLDDRFWRPLNMQIAPFHFPAPLKIINEECTEGGGNFRDKCLGLWELNRLALA